MSALSDKFEAAYDFSVSLTADQSGHSHTLTNNGVVQTAGQAVFNAAEQRYLSIADNAGMSLGGSKQPFWHFDLDLTTKALFQTLISHDSGSVERSNFIMYDPGWDRWRLDIWSGQNGAGYQQLFIPGGGTGGAVQTGRQTLQIWFDGTDLKGRVNNAAPVSATPGVGWGTYNAAWPIYIGLLIDPGITAYTADCKMNTFFYANVVPTSDERDFLTTRPTWAQVVAYGAAATLKRQLWNYLGD